MISDWCFQGALAAISSAGLETFDDRKLTNPHFQPVRKTHTIRLSPGVHPKMIKQIGAGNAETAHADDQTNTVCNQYASRSGTHRLECRYR